MKIINLSDTNSIVNQYLAEIRDKDYQKNRLLFRNNIMRIGEMMAYEISKTLDYETKDIATPLGISKVNMPTDKIVLATIFRAGLPFHTGFLNVFDHAGNAFVSAYREYTMRSTIKWASMWNISPHQASTRKTSSSLIRCWPRVEVWNWAIRRFSPREFPSGSMCAASSLPRRDSTP